MEGISRGRGSSQSRRRGCHLESMKMEIPIAADKDGVVKKLLKQEGDFINEGDDLIELE